MVNEPYDKAKLMAYVHGELGVDESRALMERLERDEDLRLELESLTQIHTGIKAHFSMDEEEEGLSLAQIRRLHESVAMPRKPRSWFIGLAFGGALVAACATLVVFVTSLKKSRENQAAVQFAEAHRQAPPAEFAAAEAPSAAAPSAAAPPPPASDLQVADATKVLEAESSAQEPAALAKSYGTAGIGAKSKAAAHASLRLESKRAVIPSPLLRSKVLTFAKPALEGGNSCLAGRTGESLKVTVDVSNKGLIKNLRLNPKHAGDATAVKCLKTRLGSRPGLLRSPKGTRLIFYMKAQ